jgi:signal transduction histidine kinase
VRHRLVAHGPDIVLPDQVAETLIRVGQEALVNVDLHAGGVAAEVRLQVIDDEWILSVTNDASDGAAEPATGDDARRHLGLAAMQRAVRTVSGRVEQHTPSDGGYVVRAIVPTHDSR